MVMECHPAATHRQMVHAFNEGLFPYNVTLVCMSECVFVSVKLTECIKYGSSFSPTAAVLARFQGEAAYFF